MVKGVKNMGRNVKSLGEMQKHLTNEEKAQRQEMQKRLYEYSMLKGTPPKWLSEYAKTEWDRIVPILIEETPISELDSGLLATYCETLATVRECSEHIAKDGSLIVNTQSGGVKPNPYVSIRERAIKDLRSLSNDLGLSISSRAKLALNKAQDDEMDEIGAMLE